MVEVQRKAGEPDASLHLHSALQRVCAELPPASSDEIAPRQFELDFRRRMVSELQSFLKGGTEHLEEAHPPENAPCFARAPAANPQRGICIPISGNYDCTADHKTGNEEARRDIATGTHIALSVTDGMEGILGSFGSR